MSAGVSGNAACSSNTRSVFAGGFLQAGAATNVINYVTTATTGNSTDFGDLTVARQRTCGTSSSVRGVFAGGVDGTISTLYNVIDYITIASAGNATDFGDLTVARRDLAACSSSLRAVFSGGTSPGTNVMDFITIASAGNAVDFGDLTAATSGLAGCSNTHGGL